MNNQSSHGAQGIVGSQIDNHNVIIISQNKEERTDSNLINSLRKSMPGSSSGLKQLTAVNKDSIFQNQQQQFQQKSNAGAMNRQSHSLGQHMSNPSGKREQQDKTNHMSHSQPHSQYQSVQTNNRTINQKALLVQNNQPMVLSSNAQVGAQNFVTQSSQVNINSLSGNGCSIIGAVQGIKFQNQAILGVTNQGPPIINHKQFSMSIQHGLFPKISNLRVENQIMPTSTHSQVGLIQGTIKQAEAMNVFKNNCGHISGMSNHHAHHNLVKQDLGTLRNPQSTTQYYLHNPPNPIASNVGADMQIGYKPLSSPRQTRHEGSSDPNQLYQQQLQWKTQGTMNYGDFKNKNTSKITEPTFSPVLANNSSLQNHHDPQRQNQMSSGSEKRLKMHQQRQYYSEQYRVAQQKQHQQTANAVLKQNGGSDIYNQQQSTNQAENSTNSTTSQQKTNGRQSQIDQLNQQDYNQLSKQEKVPQTLNQNSLQTAPLYSQQKLKNISQQIIHQNVVINGQVPPNGSTVITNHNLHNMTIQQNQQISSTINNIAQNQNVTSTTNSQVNNNQVFFKKRCSSNNNAQNMNKNPTTLDGKMEALTQAEISQTVQQKHQTMNQTSTTSPKLNQSHQGMVYSSNQQMNAIQQASLAYQQHMQQHNSIGTTQNRVNSQPSSQFKQTEGITQSLFEHTNTKLISQDVATHNHHESYHQAPSSQLAMNSTQTQQLTQQQQAQPLTTQQSIQQQQIHGSTTSSGTAAQQQPLQQQQPTSQVQGATQQQQLQQQAPPKIPVICGFHKRILLITCQNNANEMQNGMANISGINPNSSIAQARRIRNKNPNCNHNSNSVFYQPHYNNVKYDDSHKKKEDVLRKVFFKECAKEEEKRLYGGQGQMYPGSGPYSAAHGGIYGASEMARQQAFSQANDPNKHLQIIERILCEYLFVSQPFDRSGKAQLTNTQSLMMELGLDRALTPHRAFLLALIRAGKFTTDNMLKVLSEVKTSATDFDNECIYCKYSQYALKESAKLLHKHQQALIEQSQTNPQQALAAQQQIQANGGVIKGPLGEDIRIENLVRMFQSQLFKKSFINTSLMIIQRKMTEKYFQKYHNAKQAQQAAEQAKQSPAPAQYGPDGKPLGEKKLSKKVKPKQCLPNLSSLEYLAKEIQKLSKNLANPKDKERYLDLKEKYYREFLIKILKSNGVEKIQFPTAAFTPYKYYIGKGNNSSMVRTALKTRYWWSMGEYEDWSDYNFVWTQWKSNKVLNSMKTWKEVKELEAREAANPDKKRSSQSTRAGGYVESQLSTQATDKESNSSKENLITTPKKNKLASSSLGNNSSEPQFRRNGTGTNQSSATKNGKILARGKKPEDKDKDDDKEENVTSHNLMAYGKQENNYHLSNKKAFYYNLRTYFEALGIEYHTQLPLTFHVKEGLSDPQFLKFEHIYSEANAGRETVLDQHPKFGKHLWIIKPGENTNRGCGITVCKDFDQIKNLVANTNINGNKRSYIIQKYIEKPLLYKNRKFDIRTFTLMCTINGNLQGYWYSEGYLRTSCREFSLKNVNNRYVHLTNDAVQKKLEDYGRYESGNKLNYAEFQKYLDAMKIECDFVKDLVPQMRTLAQHSMRAVSRKVDPHRRAFTFEIYGYDFMIDEDLNPWMIEVNTNPCFELSSPYLARLIPALVENSLKLAVDPIFPPPPVPNSKKHTIPDATDNKFELIFNERCDFTELKNLPIDDNMNGIIEEEEKEDEGSDEDEEEDPQNE